MSMATSDCRAIPAVAVENTEKGLPQRPGGISETERIEFSLCPVTKLGDSLAKLSDSVAKLGVSVA
jgi:hypothetical protein